MDKVFLGVCILALLSMLGTTLYLFVGQLVWMVRHR